MREEAMSKPARCLATTHRDAERCVIASAMRRPSIGSGSGLLTRPPSATVGLSVLDRRCVTWRPTVGRAAGSSGDRKFR